MFFQIKNYVYTCNCIDACTIKYYIIALLLKTYNKLNRHFSYFEIGITETSKEY